VAFVDARAKSLIILVIGDVPAQCGSKIANGRPAEFGTHHDPHQFSWA
jgi:hypothetical protein